MKVYSPQLEKASATIPWSSQGNEHIRHCGSVAPNKGNLSNMATYTTNKILLEFELDPGRTMASLASVLVPILEGAFATGSNFRPVCPELVSETVHPLPLFSQKRKFISISEQLYIFDSQPHKCGQIWTTQSSPCVDFT